MREIQVPKIKQKTTNNPGYKNESMGSCPFQLSLLLLHTMSSEKVSRLSLSITQTKDESADTSKRDITINNTVLTAQLNIAG